MPPSSSSTSTEAERQRCKQDYKSRLATALNEEDDPLSLYQEFVQWTLANYGEKDPKSGLLELLEEATSQFKEDPVYKTDLRYLKLWSLYARQVERAGAFSIYATLVANEIGTSYGLLYEEYAGLLEQDGRCEEADAVYQRGIKRRARPLERLKGRYRDFQARSGGSGSGSSASIPASRSRGTVGTDGRQPPTRNQPSIPRSVSSSSSIPASSSSAAITLQSTAASRYALMMAPPAPGKRPEKLRFNLSLLFTDEKVEYSVQEARARSMGLLGKKWGPPPPSEMSRFTAAASSSGPSIPVDFNDDGQKVTRTMGMGNRRRSLMTGHGAEPTVTINTKEALADVFGMYNSPEKTSRIALPGSKHAPLKKIEPITPIVPLRHTVSQENENAMQNAKTPTPAFRPFVDENSQPKRAASTKFTPFVDPDVNKTPAVAPRPALSLKDSMSATPSNPRPIENPPPRSALKLKPVTEEIHAESVFSKVFTPAQVKPPPLAPLRDVFTDDHGKPQPKPKTVLTHERARSAHEVLAPPSEGIRPPAAFTPFVDENARTPFKVFSRPPEQDENTSASAITPRPGLATTTPFAEHKPTFTPYRDDAPAAFKPFVDHSEDHSMEGYLPQDQAFSEPEVSQSHTPPWSNTVNDVADEEEEDTSESDQYQEDYIYEDGAAGHDYEDPSPIDHEQQQYEDGESFHQVPLGGRFGQFNVMTPITERTFEFTSTRSAFGGTPSRHLGHINELEDSSNGGVMLGQVDENGALRVAERLAAELRASDDEYSDLDERPVSPLRLSDEHTSTEERTGTLSLADTLTLKSKFKPPNPCNPFDPPILSTLLSLIPTDPHYHDLQDREANLLGGLQKFAKKTKNGGDSARFPLTLDSQRFSVTDKLGEGGFGAVFRARDMGMGTGNDDEATDSDEDDDDDDDESSSMVALKVVKPRNLWEYHVLRRLHSTLPQTVRRSLVLPHALYAFRDESFLVLELCPQGTLLNIVNGAVAAGVSQQGACLDELLVVFFTIELLQLLEAMHTSGFIHGDLKIDNCLLRLEDVPGPASAWSSVYQPSGEGGWSCKGLKVIDFGRTVDTRLFPVGQEYIAEWETDDRDCFEVREDRPWTYQTDYFGLAGIVYCMLFGKYIQASSVVEVPGAVRRHKIATPLKRYWQTDLWNRLFDLLLNPCLANAEGRLPICDELGVVRKDMESWLQANCNRTSNTLKGLLKKVEMSCYVH